MATYKVDRGAVAQVRKRLDEAGLKSKQLSQGVQYMFDKGGVINVFNTGTVLTQGSNSQEPEINTAFLDHCSEFLVHDAPQNKVLVFVVPIAKTMWVKQQIEHLSGQNLSGQGQTRVTAKKADNNTLFRQEIDDGTNRLVVTQYKTGRLMVQGLSSNLWLAVSETVGMMLDATFETNVAVVLAKAGEQTEVASVVLRCDKQRALKKTTDRLGQCYAFLSQCDQDLIVSSQLLLDANLELSDYFNCVSGIIKATEGFVKKLLVTIGAFTAEEVQRREWTFREVLQGSTLDDRVVRCLSSDERIRQVQERALKGLIVRGIYGIRNKYFHDGPIPSPIPDLGIAVSLKDELLGLIANASSCFELGSEG